MALTINDTCRQLSKTTDVSLLVLAETSESLQQTFPKALLRFSLLNQNLAKLVSLDISDFFFFFFSVSYTQQAVKRTSPWTLAKSFSG